MTFKYSLGTSKIPLFDLLFLQKSVQKMELDAVRVTDNKTSIYIYPYVWPGGVGIVRLSKLNLDFDFNLFVFVFYFN